MSSDTILKDEQGVRHSYDNIKTQGWLNGQPIGAQAAVNYLREKAVGLFRNGKYDEAIAMQKLATEVLEKVVPGLEDAAKIHEITYPEELDPVVNLRRGSDG